MNEVIFLWHVLNPLIPHRFTLAELVFVTLYIQLRLKNGRMIYLRFVEIVGACKLKIILSSGDSKLFCIKLLNLVLASWVAVLYWLCHKQVLLVYLNQKLSF